MKKLSVLGILILVLVMIFGAVPSFAGNGLDVNGPHYNLNIIGVPKDKTADMTGDNGHRIFVPLNGSTKILLQEGAADVFDFLVLDANGTDGSASFQLPNPDPDADGTTWYSVYARELGKPGGSAQMTTCATSLVDELGDTYCSLYSYVAVRDKGKSSFDNVTKELLYVYADIDGDLQVERVPLFDDSMQDYYWQYDNDGLRHVQLRFYEVPTTVPVS